MNVSITRIRHRWTEESGFTLNRPNGAGEYILLHFLSPVSFTFSDQSEALQAGAFIILSPNTPHSFSSSCRLVHDWMHLKGDVKELLYRFGLQPDKLYQPNLESTISEITAFLEMEFFSRRSYWKELQMIKLSELFIRIQHESDSVSKIRINTETLNRLYYLRMEMLNRPENNWSVEYMTKMVHLSSSRLHALYKTMFGLPPKNDLILIRIEKAKRMLQQGMSVSETAAELGYSNVYHFIRQFHKQTGKSPKQFAIGK